MTLERALTFVAAAGVAATVYALWPWIAPNNRWWHA